MADPMRFHEDEVAFRDAVLFTAEQTGFGSQLVEKDYFCSLILYYLYNHGPSALAFKGGTCLAKVHAGFYRMSEDLDFSIAVPQDASRAQRRSLVEPFKKSIAVLSKSHPVFAVVQQLRGANLSTQYAAVVSYQSHVMGQRSTIQVDIGVREPLHDQPVQGMAATLLANPFRRAAVVPPFHVTCMSLRETYAEKIRASLTRQPPAIRDLYDLWYADTHGVVDFTNEELLAVAANKIALCSDAQVNTTALSRQVLERQCDSELKAVLRPADYQSFEFARAFALLSSIQASLQQRA